MAIFPLIVEGDAVGAISLYASEIEFFHEEEMKLLTELAGDIAFAIDHIEKQERLNYLAYYDVLTGLANRTLFLERAAQYIHSAISGGHKLAIGLIDLERFKNINDSLGRLAGDSLLNQVAERLTQFARDANLLARIDADHFAFRGAGSQVGWQPGEAGREPDGRFSGTFVPPERLPVPHRYQGRHRAVPGRWH